MIAAIGDGYRLCPSSLSISGSQCPAATFFLAQTNFLVLFYHTYFQLFTSIFVTDSSLDVVFNAIAVIILDIFLDSSFNHTRYFSTFLFAALLGNVLTLFLGPLFSIDSSAGASGGIFGLFAATFAYRWAEEKKIDRGTLIFFIAIFGASSIFPNVNWIAHVGGSIGGFIAGPLLYQVLRGKLANYESVEASSTMSKVILAAIIILLVVGSAFQFYLFSST